MTAPDAPNRPGTLPRRDILLLPLVSLGTAILLLAACEAIALRLWPEVDSYGCNIVGRPTPNCVTYMKNFEGPLVEYRFNNCGYRTQEPCGPKPPEARRVVVIGTSTAEGMRVPYDDMFSTVAAKKLTTLLGRPVEVQNLGNLGSQRIVNDTIPEALALQPDAILMIITPLDIRPFEDLPAIVKVNEAVAPEPGSRNRLVALLVSVVRGASILARKSRTIAVVQHYLLNDTQVFCDLYGHYRDPDDPVQVPWSDSRKREFAGFDALVGGIAGKLRDSGVPFFFVLVPNRIQAALAGSGIRIPGVDPYYWPRAVGQSASARGLGFIDCLPDFQRAPQAAKLFYTVDGHANAAGHHAIAEAIVNRLTDGSIPAFRKAAVVSQIIQ